MIWANLEQSFNRAFLRCFSWQKMLLLFPALLLCGILVVFCQALYGSAGEWIGMSLIFLPILLSTAILFSVGVLIIRMYRYELKQLPLSLKKLLIGSLNTVLSCSYLSIPSILLYLVFWVVLGIFFLIKELPGIGHLLNTILIFVPFLLIFASILLCLFNALLLFFVTPAVSMPSIKRIRLAKEVLSLFQQSPFTSICFLLIGLLPLALVALLLIWAGSLTHAHFMQGVSWKVSLQWFFMMIPFAAILTPPMIFFFNFSVEAHRLRGKL